MDTIIKFILVTALSIVFFVGPFLILALLFGGKKCLSDWFAFIRGLPTQTLVWIAWAIFWMIPIVLGFTILDLLIFNQIFTGTGLLVRVLLLVFTAYLFWTWYYFGYKKRSKRKNR